MGAYDRHMQASADRDGDVTFHLKAARLALREGLLGTSRMHYERTGFPQIDAHWSWDAWQARQSGGPKEGES